MAWYQRLLVRYEAPGCWGKTDCFVVAAPPDSKNTLNSPVIDIHFANSKTHRRVTPLVICIVVATCFLVLISCAVLCFRAFRRRRCRRRRRVLLANAEAAGGGGDDVDVVDDGDIHHVWYIRTVGLDKNTIDSITICPYKSGDGLIDTTDCSVCLSEFDEGELVRLLPKCSHAFHISCIDTWLRSHVNCPLCRAPVVVAPAPAPAFTNDLGSSSTTSGTTTVESNHNGVALSEENQNLQTNVGEDGAIENSAIAFPPPVQGSSSCSSVLGSGFRVQSDLGRCGGQTVVRNNTSDSAATRRSFSVDFAAMGVLLGEATEGSPCQDRKESSFVMRVPRGGVMEKQWSGRKGASSRGMERSASPNGGKLSLSRFSRGRGNSILPP